MTDTISLGSQSSFSTAFQFRIHSSGGSFQGGGADGLVFVVQTVSNTAGTSGAGIGYKGINNSVGIEFDTFNNATGEGACETSFGENHVGINVGGSICSNPQIDVTSSHGVLDTGGTFFAWVDFDGSTQDLEVRLSTTATRPSTALLSKTVDLVTELGTSNAFVGFTSATGGSFSAHDIVAWQFTNSFQPIQAITPDPEADLELTKTDSPDPVVAGANLTYTITVTNNSTSTAATNVQIKDKIPSGTSLVSAAVTGGSCTGTTDITCSFSTLGAGSSTVATIVVNVNTGTSGTLTNAATTTSDTLDPVTSNNTAQTTTQVSTPAADLKVTKTGSPDPVIAGTNLTYVIVVTNNSTTTAATNVEIKDKLPPGTSLVSVNATGGGTCSGTTDINCTFSSVAPESAVVATIVVKVDAGMSGPLTNIATTTADTLDNVISNNSFKAVTQVSSAPPVPNVSPWMLAALAAGLLLTFSGRVRRTIMRRVG